MKKFKKLFRLLGLIALLLLASVGVGFGAVIPPVIEKKEDEISLFYDDDEEAELKK